MTLTPSEIQAIKKYIKIVNKNKYSNEDINFLNQVNDNLIKL